MSPLELGLIELPTRPRSEYTMGVRRQALLEADGGRLMDAADLTRAAMTESGYARGILSDLTHGLWGLPRSFIGRADMISALDDTPERVGQWREMFPQPDAIRLMSWGITLGVGLGQMRRRWARPGDDFPISLEEAKDGSWRLPKKTRPIGSYDTRVLRTWDPKYLRCQWWDESWFLNTADGEIRIDPNDGEWMLYLPYGEIKPWEYGAWRALTIAFVLQRDALFDRSRHAEVLAPVRVGTVPQGTTQRQRELYMRQIRTMQRMGAFVLPPGLDYKIVESSGRIADIYDKIIEWANGDYAMITGAITTATGSPGFSKGDVQERFTRAVLSSLGSSLASCLHAGGLVPWAIENYGDPNAPRPEFDAVAPEDKLVRAQTIGAAGDALVKLNEGLKTAGKRLTAASVEKFAQTLGFEVEDIPAGQTPVAKLELAPTDIAKVVRASEVRASQGLPAFGDERDDMTIPELDAHAKALSEPPPMDGAPVGSALNVEAQAMGEPPTDGAAAALAVAMSHHKVERCEHGCSNRCPRCGVERDRGFDVGPDGQPIWHIAWRPIFRAISNGAIAPSPGGIA